MAEYVKQGEKVRLSAASWNSFVELTKTTSPDRAVLAEKNSRKNADVLVEAYADLEMFEPVKLDAPSLPADEMPFQMSPIFSSVAPEEGQPFVIVAEPVASGGVVRAKAVGCVLANVLIVDFAHEYCGINIDGDLATSASGYARIIWMPAEADLEDQAIPQICLISLCAVADGGTLFEAVTDHGDYLMCAKVASLSATQQPVPVDPGEAEETLFKVWKPWLLRSTPFDTLTRDGITYDYHATTIGLRKATDATPTEEWQTITPSYSLRITGHPINEGLALAGSEHRSQCL